MNIYKSSTIVLFLCAGMSGVAGAGDRIDKRPLPPGTVVVKPDAASIQATIDTRLRDKFDAAAGKSNHLLTAQQSIDAGWGFLADHFAEIDRNHDGYLNLTEVETFFNARSAIKSMRKQPVQVVE
jgi:hypothetical protein